jgi:hypothetical protein
MPGVAELFDFCAKNGIMTACITNNATMTPAQFSENSQAWISSTQLPTSSIHPLGRVCGSNRKPLKAPRFFVLA